MENKSKWLFGGRMTSGNPKEAMENNEWMLNNCYAEGGKAMYRDHDGEYDIRHLIVEIVKTLSIHINATSPDALDFMLFDWLEDGIESRSGILALLYNLLWSKAELYESLKRYEDAEERGEIGPVPRWIPVTERMPEKAGDYLCVCNDGENGEPYVVIIQYNDEREAFGHEVNVYDSYTLGFVDTDFEEWPVTHWMPLPALPEVE